MEEQELQNVVQRFNRALGTLDMVKDEMTSLVGFLVQKINDTRLSEEAKKHNEGPSNI